jgi:hypothetical protein
MWYYERQSLVEYGIARFVGNTPTSDDETPVQVDEPLALVALVRYFESRHLTLERHIRATMQDNKGLAFEESVLLAITKLLRGGRKLNQVFEFYKTTPDWSNHTAKVVTRMPSGDCVDFGIIGHDSVFPSTGLAFYARTPKAVKGWLEGGGAGWCIPGNSMGPDLMAWLRLDDGRFLLLVIQAKCHLTGNINTLSAEVTADAIRSLMPSKFFTSLVCRWCLPSGFALIMVYL